jgi:hypothetical protein
MAYAAYPASALAEPVRRTVGRIWAWSQTTASVAELDARRDLLLDDELIVLGKRDEDSLSHQIVGLVRGVGQRLPVRS